MDYEMDIAIRVIQRIEDQHSREPDVISKEAIEPAPKQQKVKINEPRKVIVNNSTLPLNISKTVVFRNNTGVPKCFYCHKIGHVVKYCRNRPTQSGRIEKNKKAL